MKFSPRENVGELKCLACGSSYEYGKLFTSPRCGLEGILDVQYDYDFIAKHLTPDALAEALSASSFIRA